jgi:hypothetical protein
MNDFLLGLPERLWLDGTVCYLYLYHEQLINAEEIENAHGEYFLSLDVKSSSEVGITIFQSSCLFLLLCS